MALEENSAQANSDDDFSKAFNDLALNDGKPPLDPAPRTDEQVAAPEVKTEIVAPLEPKEGEEKKPAGGETKTSEPEPAPTTQEPKLASADDIAQAFAKVMRQDAPQPEVQQHQAQVYSSEETAFLHAFATEWPDPARAMQIQLRATVAQLVPYIFAEVAKTIQPVMEIAQAMGERAQLDDLRSHVNDYDDIRDGVVSWVDKQPAYLQPAYKHVIEQGTLEQVTDLIERYRKDTGTVAKSAEPAQTTKDAELSPAAKQAAARLAPVSSKRSTPTAPTDALDFDGAFQKALAAMDKS
jgi:hypothetical protein